jgi:deazaflavin-dependent oxidoreductase (nitroreductase family)
MIRSSITRTSAVPLASALADLDYCYLTTTGRTSGEPRTIEIWFAANGDSLYLLSGGGDRSHWVKNLLKHPEVSVRVGGRDFAARGRIIADAAEQQTARSLVFDKYRTRDSDDLTGWRDRSLPIALDLLPAP